MRRRSAAALVLLVCLTPSPARAQGTDDAAVYETTVSAARPPTLAEPPPLAPADVQTIDRAEIEASGATTVQAALQDLAGVVLEDEQGSGAQLDVVVRGVPVSPVTGLPQGISVFVDGVRVNEPTAEEVNFDLLPLADVERIVVVRGPGALSGRNTLAGAIYILTRRGTRPMLEGEAGLGSFGRRQARVRAGGTLGRWDGYLSAGYASEDGFRQAGAARAAQLFAKVGVGGARGDLTLSYQLQADRIQQPGSLPASLLAQDRTANFSPGDFFAPALQQGTLNGYRALTPALSLVGQGFGRALDGEQLNLGAGGGGTRVRSRIRGAGGALALVWRRVGGWTRSELRVGVDGAAHQVGVRVVAQPQTIPPGCDPVREDCAGATLAADLADAQRAAGFFAHEAFQIGPALLGGERTLSLSLGLRGDRVSHDIDDTTPATPGAAAGTARYARLLPAAAVRYGLSPRLTVGAIYAHGFRAPAFLELTCSQPTSPCIGLQAGAAPDADFGFLRPVRARDYELDVDLTTAGGRAASALAADLDLAVFRTDFLDDIFSVSPTRTTVVFQNVGRTRRQGVEAHGRLRRGQWGARLDYAFVRATFQDDLVLASPRDPQETVAAGSRLPLVPAQTVRGALTFAPGWGVTLSADAAYVGPSFFRGDEANTQPQLAGYWLLGAGLHVQHGPWWGVLRATNLLDRRHETFGTFAPNGAAVEPFLSPGAPLSLFAQVGYRFAAAPPLPPQ